MTAVVWNRASVHQLLRGFLADGSERLPLTAVWALRLAEWRLRRR